MFVFCDFLFCQVHYIYFLLLGFIFETKSDEPTTFLSCLIYLILPNIMCLIHHLSASPIYLETCLKGSNY